VYDLSGEILSSLQGQKNHKKLNAQIKKIILMPKRSELHERIEERFIDMLKNGFLDEVETLRNNKKLNLDLASMRCVGYRQVWNYFDGKYNKKEMIEKAIVATRQLCKRQSTWLKNEKEGLLLSHSDINRAVNFLQSHDA
jgi:tRNA dimethylallyltransferase